MPLLADEKGRSLPRAPLGARASRPPSQEQAPWVKEQEGGDQESEVELW